MTAARSPAWRAIGANLVLAGAALLLALGAAELVLRLLGVGYPVYVWADPERGLAHIPGAKSPFRYQGHSWIEINSDGMRGPEISLAHPGTYRIALLGDSFIEAFEVPFEKTVGELVSRRLSATWRRPVEVLNFGTGGYGTTQELLTLRQQVWKYTPDLVLLAVTTGNDIADNYRPLSQDAYRPYYVYRGDALVLDTSFRRSPAYRSRALWTRHLLGIVQSSRLVQLANRIRHTSRKSARQERNSGAVAGDEPGLLDGVQLPPPTPDWREAWRVTEGVLGLMREECRRHGVPFAVVTLSRGVQVSPDPKFKEQLLRRLGAPDLYYPEHRIAEFGRREGVPVLNLAPAMARLAEERHVYFHAFHDSLGIGHWNEAGHAAAAELIATWLARSDAFDGRAGK